MREVGEVGDAGVREDELHAGVLVDEPLELGGDRRQPAPGVDQDRDVPLGGEREHRREPLVVEQELLRPRVQLDPARAEVEAARRLLHRPLVEREPHERDQPALRARGELERPVVAGLEAGMTVGLVEAEHERPGDAVGVEQPDELLVAPDHPVDVVAEVRVRVEDLQAGRQVRRSRSSHPAATSRARSSASTSRNLSPGVPASCRLRKGHCRAGARRRYQGVVQSSRIGDLMKRMRLLVLLAFLALPLGTASARGSGAGSVVVTEVFAAGGNSGAPYANDYVELFNRGSGGPSRSTAAGSSTRPGVRERGGNRRRSPARSPPAAVYLVGLASGGTRPALRCLRRTRGKVEPGRHRREGRRRIERIGALLWRVGRKLLGSFQASRTSSATATRATMREAAPSRALEQYDGGRARGRRLHRRRRQHRRLRRDDAGSAERQLAATTRLGGPQAGGSGGAAGVDVDVQPVLSLALDHASLSFPDAVPGTIPSPGAEQVDVTSNDSNGYALGVDRTAFAPADLPLGIGVGGAAPRGRPGRSGPRPRARDGERPERAGGDAVDDERRLRPPLPAVPSGHYSATLTFTVIGR